VVVQVEGKGSSTAPPALIEGVAQLGPMSRKMKKEEIEEFEKKLGYQPTAIGVGLDALAVYVNKDNPLDSLSLPEVDAIFSKTRKGGHEAIETWGQAGVSGELAAHPISLYGRNSASGTYGYFKKNALFKGDFKDAVKEQPGSASVVMGITEDLKGIGYSGIGYQTSGVKTLKLSKKKGEHAYEATAENVLSKNYPLGRLLYVYIAKKPNEPLPPVVKEFLKYVLSKEGQRVVAKDGYIPLPAALAEQQIELLD
jgi:phosphate transport system substrate-binding protein